MQSMKNEVKNMDFVKLCFPNPHACKLKTVKYVMIAQNPYSANQHDLTVCSVSSVYMLLSYFHGTAFCRVKCSWTGVCNRGI